jgi:FkbM family methyltransferase
MKILSLAKRIARSPFRALGLDLVRHSGRASPSDATRFDRHYQPEEHWLARSGIRTVLDVGAHEGEFAGRILEIIPNAALVCFEPLAAPYKVLASRFSKRPNFRAMPYALADTAGRFEIQHNEYSPSSSLLPLTALHKESFRFAQKQTAETIEVRRLSDTANELAIEYPLLLKLDVQGFEDKVIAGGEDVVAQTSIMIVEVSFQPLYQGGPLFDDIYRMLTKRGFSYQGNFEQLLSPHDGRVLQADAIFCRS